LCFAFHDLRFSYLRWEAIRGTGETDSTLGGTLWQMAKSCARKGWELMSAAVAGTGMDTSKTGI